MPAAKKTPSPKAKAKTKAPTYRVLRAVRTDDGEIDLAVGDETPELDQIKKYRWVQRGIVAVIDPDDPAPTPPAPDSDPPQEGEA